MVPHHCRILRLIQLDPVGQRVARVTVNVPLTSFCSDLLRNTVVRHSTHGDQDRLTLRPLQYPAASLHSSIRAHCMESTESSNTFQSLDNLIFHIIIMIVETLARAKLLAVVEVARTGSSDDSRPRSNSELDGAASDR